MNLETELDQLVEVIIENEEDIRRCENRIHQLMVEKYGTSPRKVFLTDKHVNLIRRLGELGWSQRRLERSFLVSNATICRYLNGQRRKV
jgi:hypothetical protein